MHSTPLSRHWAIVLTLLTAVIVFQAMALVVFSRRKETIAVPSAPQEPGVPRKDGPWGALRATRIFIEPPDDIVDDGLVAQSDWLFRGYTLAQYLNFWATLPLTPVQSAYVANPANHIPWEHGIVLHPSTELVRGLSLEARRRLYQLLGSIPDNLSLADPFRYRADRLADWFSRSGLKPETISSVRPYIYRQGVFWVFADLPTVQPLIPDPAERHLLLKVLARESALLVELKLDRNSDLAGLVAYWGRGAMSRDIRVLLDSISQSSDGPIWVDIAHLLPRLPRSRLYSYPVPGEPGVGSYMNCHWSSLNFFRAPTDTRYATDETASAAFKSEYREVAGPPLFGDIVAFVDANGGATHSCVYLADGIVYSKNGNSLAAPWVLAELDILFGFYSITTPVRQAVFRRLGY